MEQGLESYRQYQIAREKDVLEPGVGFDLVHKLLKINELSDNRARIEVVLISRNSPDTGLRVLDSAKALGLNISRAIFCGGRNAYRYAQPLGVHLFLSANVLDVNGALREGVPSAVLLPSNRSEDSQVKAPGPCSEVRVAFDGDAVLFHAGSEHIFRDGGLEAFIANEEQYTDQPMQYGPFFPFAKALQTLQAIFPPDQCPIRTALVTARSMPTHKRAVLTLRRWNIRLDEAMFLGSDEKAAFLQAFGADIFFDDKLENCRQAAELTTAAHVPEVSTGHTGDAPSLL